VAAGANAKKTIAGMAAAFPRSLQGRAFELILDAATYASGIETVLGGVVGADPASIVRGTVTNATGSSVAFAGDAADYQMCGFVTTSGMNAAGYNPTAATPVVWNAVTTGTELTLQKAGGGAPTFPAEPALPLGWRLRFAANTTTVALRNVSFFVWRVTTNSITVDAPIAPVASDVCFLEMPGVVVPSMALGNGSGPFSVLGLRSSGTASIDGMTGAWFVAGVGSAGRFDMRNAAVSSRTTFLHPSLGNIVIGCGGRSEAETEAGGCSTSLFSWSTKTDLIVTQSFGHEDAGSVIGRRFFIRGHIPLVTQTHGHQVIGSGGANHGAGAPTRFAKADSDLISLEIDSADLTVEGVEFESGAAGGIIINGSSRVAFGALPCRGTVLSAAGLMLRTAVKSIVQIFDTDLLTITGTKNDIELLAAPGQAGFAYAPWSTLTNLVFGMLKDCAGNVLVGGVPTAAHGNGNNSCNAELIGKVVGLKNSTGGPVPQWSILTESISNVFLPTADAAGNATGLCMVGLTPAANGDWIICALEATRVPVIFDVAPVSDSPVYMSTANAGQVQVAVPAAAGTNQKRRLGTACYNSSMVSRNCMDFRAEILTVAADGNP
jgi:hypothetical protein